MTHIIDYIGLVFGAAFILAALALFAVAALFPFLDRHNQ